MSAFQAIYQRSLNDAEGFWGQAAAGLDWDRPWDQVLDRDAKPVPRWFAGGRLNTCFNARDRHVENGRADQAALIYDSAVTGAKRIYSYRELRDAVAAFKKVAVVKRRPKTRSGKILRGTMVKIADDNEWKMPATIDDPAILDEITEALRGLGHAGS